MQFLFNLERERERERQTDRQTLLAHPQEALHERNLVYCVRVMSVGCVTKTARTTSLDTTHPSTIFYRLHLISSFDHIS
jgi:hypothetical protein